MKQYVFRQSSTTPDEVIAYLDEKTKTMSFPKLLESLVMKDLGNASDSYGSAAVSSAELAELKDAIEAQGRKIDALAHKPAAVDVTGSVRSAVLPFFKRMDEATSMRFKELRRVVEASGAASAELTVDEQVLKRNVYVSTLAALKRYEMETGFNSRVLSELSDIQTLFLVELGNTAGEQLEVLEKVREDIDALIEYLSDPKYGEQVVSSNEGERGMESAEPEQSPIPAMEMEEKAHLVEHVAEEDEDDLFEALQFLYGDEDKGWEEKEEDDSIDLLALLAGANKSGKDDTAPNDAVKTEPVPGNIASEDVAASFAQEPGESPEVDELEVLAALLHEGEEWPPPEPVPDDSGKDILEDATESTDKPAVFTISQASRARYNGGLNNEELDALADVLGL